MACPIVAIAGTCMNSGKTAAAAAPSRAASAQRLVVDAFKSTGVALRRDILAMEDCRRAARRDVLRLRHRATTSKNARRAHAQSAERARDRETRRDRVRARRRSARRVRRRGDPARQGDRERVHAVVLCANDPVGAWGGAKLLREEFGIEPTVISGPATDNQVGIDIIRERSQRRGDQRDDAPRRARRPAAGEHRPRRPDREGRLHELHATHVSRDRARRVRLRGRRVLAADRRAPAAHARRRGVDEPSRRARRQDVRASRARVPGQRCSCRSTP